jgi:hypothetical protein
LATSCSITLTSIDAAGGHRATDRAGTAYGDSTRDPENALIIEGGLSGPALTPQRIEIWRYSDKRMDAIRSMMKVYEVFRRPPAGWEPSPDLAALRQIVERGNQWLRNQLVDEGDGEAKGQWRVEPLLVGLPEDLRTAKGVAELITPDAQKNGVFADWEGRLLEQAVWCRDIAQWARGDALSDLDAVWIFDWTVQRNSTRRMTVRR